MNILLFVTTLLMVMAIATYGQLESFFDLARLRQQHKHYMEKMELRDYNDKQLAVLDYLAGITEEDDEGDDETVTTEPTKPTPATKEVKAVKPRVKADKKLNIYNLLIKKPKPESTSTEASANPSATDKPATDSATPPSTAVAATAAEVTTVKSAATNTILKRLMQELYGHSLFYKRAFEKDPDILDKLIAKLSESAEHYEGEIDPITTTSQLSELQLGDEELWDLFYHMLKGTKEYNLEKEPKQGYPPLSKYVKVSPKIQKVRTYLASEEVLRAIYADPEVVKKMIEERLRLHALVKNDSMKSEEASQIFQEQFGNHKYVDDEGLDFTVNKTYPK